MILETAILIPVVTGLAEVVKRLFKVNSDVMPFISVLIGLILAIVGFYTIPSIEITLFEAIFMGLVAGLSGCGLYDAGAKAFAK
ncbi:hypothetical protein KBB74_02880 [Candidatus Parcubacteria bacterium]|jgi:hypothetical protein|nr:hypothetical protein [Candidatus Parcubacteria bacterium]